MEVQVEGAADAVHISHPLGPHPLPAHQPDLHLPALASSLCLRDFFGHQNLFCSAAHDRPEGQRISNLYEEPSTTG